MSDETKNSSINVNVKTDVPVEHNNENVMSEFDNTLNDMKVGILLKAFDHTQTNYRFLFSRNQTIFAWVGSMFIVVIGGNAVFSNSPSAAIKLIVTIAISVLYVFAWIMDIIIFKSQVSEGKAALRIGRVLHFFEAGFFDDKTEIFDEKDWSDWMNSPLRNIGISHGTAMLFVLAAIAVISIWL